jgi:hypothetical protein
VATILFTSPHQDDSDLYGAYAIYKHVQAGHDVHVLLHCGGVESAAQPGSGLSRPKFGRARDDEFIRASRQLGIPYENIHFARVSPPDGQLSVQVAYDAIQDFAEDHPGTWLKAYSHLTYGGRHQDHINSGLAARKALQDGLVDNLRCYIEPWLISSFPTGIAISTDTVPDNTQPHLALDEYGRVDPMAGMYGIGFQSVNYFAQVKANGWSKYHLPVM